MPACLPALLAAPASLLRACLPALTALQFLDGRPEVPRLQLGKLTSAEEPAQAGGSEGQYQTAKELPQHSPAIHNVLVQPAVPLANMGQLMSQPAPAAPPAPKLSVQAARIPAANFSPMDANFRHPGAVFPAGSVGEQQQACRLLACP